MQSNPGSQILEAIVLYLDDAGIHIVSASGEQTLRVEWDPDLHPGEMVVDAAAGLGLSPFMVHSTSWRLEDRTIVLTFLVVVEAPETLPDACAEELVARTGLARGRLMGPPPEVHVTQVIEHGLRHLAWLVSDDPEIHEALPEWVEVLSAYEREPSRAFGHPPDDPSAPRSPGIG